MVVSEIMEMKGVGLENFMKKINMFLRDSVKISNTPFFVVQFSGRPDEFLSPEMKESLSGH